jgi:hypothetical protein
MSIQESVMTLTRKDGSIVVGMLSRGDKNQDIAAWFGENPARIVEVADGTMFGSVPEAAPANELPPKGAIGPKARKLKAYVLDALKALEKGPEGIKEAADELIAGLKQFDKHEA